MIDPNDPGTLDLVAACEEPMSGAERARRHRLKKKRLKQTCGLKELPLLKVDRDVLVRALGMLERIGDGSTTPEYRLELLRKLAPNAEWPAVQVDDNAYRGFWDSNVAKVEVHQLQTFTLELTAEELDEVTAAVCTHWRAWEKYRNGWRARAAQSLWRRWVKLRWGYSYSEDDPQWSSAAVEAEAAQVRKELKHAAWGDPESLPFMLTRRDRNYLTAALDYYEYSRWPDGGKDSFERNNLRELYIRLGENSTYGDATDWPSEEKREGYEARNTWLSLCKSRDQEIVRLKKQVASLEAEQSLLIQERGRAIAAAQVFEERLRAARLSTDCRKQPDE